jgi:hypothetical protein
MACWTCGASAWFSAWIPARSDESRMKLLHWMKREASGLARSTLELCNYEQRAGHEIAVREPGADTLMYGQPFTPDIHLIHSQLSIKSYHDSIPKIMWMHG